MDDLVTKDHFTDLRSQVAKIKADNESIVFDYEADEKEARSHVATLRKSKTAVNNIHKEKKKFFLEEGRKIDAGKNELIAEIETMIDVHAKPLQEIKDRKDAEIEIERLKVERDLDWDDALVEDSLFNREREMKRKEEAHAKIEAARIAKEKAEADEKNRLEYEAKIKADAEAKAKKDAEEKIAKDHAEAKQNIIDIRSNRLLSLGFQFNGNSTSFIKDGRMEIDHNDLFLSDIKFEQMMKSVSTEIKKIDAEITERCRLADIETARLKAEKDQKNALAKQKADQDAKEKAEIARLEAERVIAERKAKNLNHVKAVNNKVLKKILPFCSSEQKAKDLIENLIKEKIIEITINY